MKLTVVSNDDSNEHIFYSLVKEKHKGHEERSSQIRIPCLHSIKVKVLNHHPELHDDREEDTRVLLSRLTEDAVTHYCKSK